MTDFRRMKWRPYGSTNSVARKMVVPRVSMIVGLDTDGEVYLSLIQSNSNAKIMEIFFRQLTLKLDAQRPNWRQSHVILMDNATYHTNPTILNVLELLRIPVIFTGPHSYKASPVETFFAAFKAADINPRKLATGKS